jgi:hypothetical protein
MTKSSIRFLGQLISSGAVLVFIGLLILLAVKSFPVSQASISAYPAPNNIGPTLSSLSPEVLCDQWFAYRKEQSEDIRAMIEEDYTNCVNARKTPSPVGVNKPIPGTPSISEYSSPFLRRAAGAGTIIETNFSPLNSNFKIRNQWISKLDGKNIKVYAGGRQSDSASGDGLLNELSWPGVLLVTISDESGKPLPEEGGMFWTPQNSGPVRIVTADETILTLVANDGNSFKFDVADQKYLSTEAGPLVIRPLSSGILIESGIVKYQINGIEFVNQWSYKLEGVGTMTALAGNDENDIHSGVLVILVSSTGDNSKVLEKVAFKTNLGDGALRIIDVEGNILTIVSESGLVYEFDFTSRKFITVPSGSEMISGILLTIDTPYSEAGPVSVTNTVTQTPSPRPTRTPLPTYNPYP